MILEVIVMAAGSSVIGVNVSDRQPKNLPLIPDLLQARAYTLAARDDDTQPMG